MRTIRTKYVVILTILYILAAILYVTLVPRKVVHTTAWYSTMGPFGHFEPTFSNYTPVLVEDDEEAEMGNYSHHVKERLRDIKENLQYRPPLSILPFVRMMGHYVAAPKYDLATCVVEKSMCTQMNSILCYLYDTEAFLAANRSILTENWFNTFCKHKNNYNTWKAIRMAIPKRLETTFITRDPVQRFINAYIDKCVNEGRECYGCKTNEILEIKRQKRYMIMGLSYEGRHFAPLTWYCDLWDRFEEYHFIKYGEDNESFSKTRSAVLNFFEKQGVEAEKIEHIDNALNSRSSHATKTTFSDLRQETLNILLKSHKHLTMLYYYDFIAFGFNSPVDIYYWYYQRY